MPKSNSSTSSDAASDNRVNRPSKKKGRCIYKKSSKRDASEEVPKKRTNRRSAAETKFYCNQSQPWLGYTALDKAMRGHLKHGIRNYSVKTLRSMAKHLAKNVFEDDSLVPFDSVVPNEPNDSAWKIRLTEDAVEAVRLYVGKKAEDVLLSASNNMRFGGARTLNKSHLHLAMSSAL